MVNSNNVHNVREIRFTAVISVINRTFLMQNLKSERSKFAADIFCWLEKKLIGKKRKVEAGSLKISKYLAKNKSK